MTDSRPGRQELTGAEIVLPVAHMESDAALDHLDRDGTRRLVLGQLAARAEDDEGHAEGAFLQKGPGGAACPADDLGVRRALTLLVDVEDEDVSG